MPRRIVNPRRPDRIEAPLKKRSGIKTFWFDLGNVILFFDFGPAFERLARHTHLEPAQIRRYFETRSALEADVDEGRMNASGLFKRIRRDLQLRKRSEER